MPCLPSVCVWFILRSSLSHCPYLLLALLRGLEPLAPHGRRARLRRRRLDDLCPSGLRREESGDMDVVHSPPSPLEPQLQARRPWKRLLTRRAVIARRRKHRRGLCSCSLCSLCSLCCFCSVPSVRRRVSPAPVPREAKPHVRALVLRCVFDGDVSGCGRLVRSSGFFAEVLHAESNLRSASAKMSDSSFLRERREL